MYRWFFVSVSRVWRLGSAAAWVQRRFWGAAVKQGSWFSILQAAGMRTPGICRIFGSSIGLGVGISAGLFRAAVERGRNMLM